MKCQYCGKEIVLTKKGQIPPHITPGQQRCIGAGITPKKDENE